MRLAFYAPLKPPAHPVPSGDRRMARLLLAALRRAGHRPELASRLRSRDGTGDPARQRTIEGRAGRAAATLLRRYRSRPAAERPAAWLTYHLYYKAPDLLGPIVAEALGIPYLLAEASHAPKRADGPWGRWHALAAAAIRRADAVLTLNQADAECLALLPGVAPRLVPLKPFLDLAPFADAPARRADARRAAAAQLALDPGRPWLLAAAMMRPGDKLASYRLLAAALDRLKDRPWQLVAVGDGPARPAVEAAFAILGPERVRFSGALAEAALRALYAAADLYVWPAVNEAYGMALLEAQASGLPAVAGRAGGVAGILADGETGLLVPAGDPAAFAAALRDLLGDPVRRQAMAAAARAKTRAEHGIEAAAALLDTTLRRLVPAMRAA